MYFNNFHKVFFDAVDGSFSMVTEREFYDSQITLTDFEADLVLNYFGPSSIWVGNKTSNPSQALKTFYLYPNKIPISLNLVFPKPNKSELRLYISKSAGFKPRAGTIWFLFIDSQRRLNIGSLNVGQWHQLGQEDTEDDEYQNSIVDTIIKVPTLIAPPKIKKPKEILLGSRVVYQRDPLIALYRIQKSDYKCEINQDHLTFIAESTSFPFMEAHHLIPLKFQKLFTDSLDDYENIVCLCPNCHRGFHHAKVRYKISLIQKIYSERPLLQKFTLDQIVQFYNVDLP